MSTVTGMSWRAVDDGEAIEIAVDLSAVAQCRVRIPTELIHEMYAVARSQQLGVDARGDL
jgi:hypothetical protein